MKDKIIFETFVNIGSYEVRNMTMESPSCFNGNVRVKKFKVTIEEIEEPDNVIAERVQKLWDECDNIHNRDPLKAMAKNVGLALQWNPLLLVRDDPNIPIVVKEILFCIASLIFAASILLLPIVLILRFFGVKVPFINIE